MREEDMTQIPLWIIASLGRQVVLAGDFVGAAETYKAGRAGRLVGIMVDDDNYAGKPYALVALDPDDSGYMENFRFDELEPLSNKVKFSLNIEEGIIAF